MGELQGAAPASRLSVPLRGVEERPIPAIGLVLVSNLVFSAMDAVSKVLAQSFHPVEVAWGRYLFISLLLVPFVLRSRGRVLRTVRPVLQIGRGLCLIGSSLFFIFALVHLPMAEAIAISFISPLLVTALSIPLLGEKVGIRRWLAALAGFLGVLIVIRPGTAAFDPAAGFPLLSASCWATGIIITRRMGASDAPLTTMVYSGVVGLLVTSVTVATVWHTPSPAAWLLMLGMGLLGTCGHYLLVLSYRWASASVLAPFSYTQMLSSTLAGYVVFSALPDLGTWVGGGVVIASGLYTLHREHVVRHGVARAR